MKLSTRKCLAELAMKQAEGYKLTKGESTEVSTGALIHAYGQALCSWADIEGVRLKRTPKPVNTEEVRNNPEVKKMIVMSDLINDECHTFNNLIILN